MCERVGAANKEAWKKHTFISDNLDEEQKDDEDCRKKYGHKWDVVPSRQITSKYHRDCDLVHKYLSDAFIANQK